MTTSSRTRVVCAAVIATMLGAGAHVADATVCRRAKGQLVERESCRAHETAVEVGTVNPTWVVVDATGREIGTVAGISNGTVHALATMQLPDATTPEPVEIVLTPSGLVTMPFTSGVLSRSATCEEPLFVAMDTDRFATQLFPIRDSLGGDMTARVLYARPSERISTTFSQVTIASAPTPEALDCGVHDAGHGPGQVNGGSVPSPCANGFGNLAGTTFPDGYSCVQCCQPVWRNGAPVEQWAAPAHDLPRVPGSPFFVGQPRFAVIQR